MGKLTVVVIAALVGVACGARLPSAAVVSPSPSPGASPSAVASPGSSPRPVTGAFGVLYAPSMDGATYTVSLVGVDGKVVASAQASMPAQPTCSNGAAIGLVPRPVSASNSRLYFMDGQGVVRFLAPNGDSGRATTVPLGAARRSMFAVSPDDKRIAVVVADFNSSGASTMLYVEDVNGGGNHFDPFTETGAFTLWPVGWHGMDNLVVAKIAACTVGCSVTNCLPQEYHVVDPTTAVRRFTIGGPECIIAGPPSPAGSVCEDTNFRTATTLDWTAVKHHDAPITGRSAAYIAPSSNGGVEGITVVAFVFGADTVISGTSRSFSGMQACGWIDDTHVLAGGDTQHQPRVGDVTTGNIVPVATTGDCAGRIPGGL